MKLLCKIGWHRWVYNIENFNLVNGFGGRYIREFKTRTCKSCNKKQHYTQNPLVNGVSNNEWKNSN